MEIKFVLGRRSLIDMRRWLLIKLLYIEQVVNHPSKVIEIQMKKAGFHHEAGQVSLFRLFIQ